MNRRQRLTVMEELGAAVREARARAGLSQRDLEALSGVDQSAISRMERGRIPGMRLEKFARVAVVLGDLLLVWPDTAARGDASTRLAVASGGLTGTNGGLAVASEQAGSVDALLTLLVGASGPETDGWPSDLLDG